MPRVTKVTWTPDEEAKLRQLAAQGASLMRASAALNRSTSAVRTRAAALGLTLAGPKRIQALLRSKS